MEEATMSTRIHPITGKTLARGVRSQVVAFGSLSKVIDVPGWYPDDDSDAVHSGRDLAQWEKTLQELRAAYVAHVRRVRKRLKLTQVEAGLLIGGGPRAFQKYEAGVMAPSDAAVGLLEVLAADPAKVEVLRALRRAVAAGPDDGARGAQAGVRPSRDQAAA